MAKNPKTKDPTEVALSAIQDALNLGGVPSADSTRLQNETSNFRADGNDETRYVRPPANDDRVVIGDMLQSIQKGRPRRSAYTIATLFAGLWIVGGGILTFKYLPALETVLGSEGTGVLALVGLGVLFLAPLMLFYSMASLAWRGQELSMIAQSMAQMAMRFSEPENMASESMVSIGQAIRREVSAMGDGVERAIARAGELEVLVSNEVASLERAYSDNEQRIRALLDGISLQRDNLVGQAEQVHNAISTVQLDLRQDIEFISDAITARVEQVSQSIAAGLEERSAYITQRMSEAGENMIVALGERGGDLLDRLEDASSQTAASVLDATERLTQTLDFKTGSVHDEFAELADKVHDMLNERIDRVTHVFEDKSYAIVDGIASRTEEVQGVVTNAGNALLAHLDTHTKKLVEDIEYVGDQVSERILTSGEKASDSLDVTVNTLVAKVVSQTETVHDSLADQLASFNGLVQLQGTELAERFARDSNTLGALISRHVSEFDRTVKTYGSEIVERMGTHTQGLTDNMKTYVETFDSRVAGHGDAMQGKLDERLTHYEAAIDQRVAALDSSFGNKVSAFDSSIVNRLKGLEESFGARAESIASVIDDRSSSLSGTVTARFQEMQAGLEARFVTVVTDVASRVAQFEVLLDSRVDTAAKRLEASGLQAGEILSSRAEMLANSIRTNVEDASRLLTESNTSIQSGAQNAQQALITMAAEVGTHLKATTTDIERSVQNAAREATIHLNTSTAEIERLVFTATDNFGKTMNTRIEAMTSGVREQTEQLTQLVDDKRGMLLHGLGAKADEIAVTIGNATETALKSIESHGGAFTVAMMSNSSDLARQINTASDVAIGAVSKALKDIETSSRSAIDQSREVATTTVTELQETSKMLRTDTLGLFERLREGNVLLQEVLSGAHQNLNSLERALVTRVADFVTTMNDVTSRNGTSTSALELQINVFNTKTTTALEQISAIAAQFESHGNTIAEAARLVDQSNSSTERSVAERNAALETIIGTLDIRTQDMDQRLNRFTALLDESLEAAETRTREIAHLVAETAGTSANTVNRQFEAVRIAVEDERRHTAEAMSDIYEQSTRESDAMFRQAADKFASIVNGMKQMANELHEELDATRAELRRGVLDMPQEAAESTAQMRKVIVDQIDALAELNRIVARHGSGLDVASMRRREEEPVLEAANGPARNAPQQRRDTSSSLPPADFGPAPRRTEAPSVAPANGDGWMNDMIQRNDDNARGNARGPSNPLESLALDISRLVDRELAAEMWDRYQRGERKAFTKRLYTPGGQKAFDEVARKYRADRNFKQTVDRYINEFEKLLDDVARDERGPAALRNQLTSETGLVYTLLAHAAGRLN